MSFASVQNSFKTSRAYTSQTHFELAQPISSHTMKPSLALRAGLVVSILLTAANACNQTTPAIPRLVIYFQSTHDANGHPVSLLPLLTPPTSVTHVILSALHVNENGTIHLNDHLPGDPVFSTLWSDVANLRQAGVKIMAMVGGAAAGSFAVSTLDGDQAAFQKHYSQLERVVRTYDLEGLDLDVEQNMSQQGIARLVKQLRQDFGPEFLITLAPVASALLDGANLSGFDYDTLEGSLGSDIAFYNVQFYNGFGSMSSPSDYKIIANKLDPFKVVAGLLTSQSKGTGWVPFAELSQTVRSLRDEYSGFGGVAGWEYSDSLPGGQEQPWKWAQHISEVLHPHGVAII